MQYKLTTFIDTDYCYNLQTCLKTTTRGSEILNSANTSMDFVTANGMSSMSSASCVNTFSASSSTPSSCASHNNGYYVDNATRAVFNDNCDVLLVPRYKLSGLGRRAFRVAGPLVWNSITDYLRDPALKHASVKRQLKDICLCPLLHTTYRTH